MPIVFFSDSLALPTLVTSPMFLVGNQYHELRPRDSSYTCHGGCCQWSAILYCHSQTRFSKLVFSPLQMSQFLFRSLPVAAIFPISIVAFSVTVKSGPSRSSQATVLPLLQSDLR